MLSSPSCPWSESSSFRPLRVSFCVPPNKVSSPAAPSRTNSSSVTVLASRRLFPVPPTSRADSKLLMLSVPLAINCVLVRIKSELLNSIRRSLPSPPSKMSFPLLPRSVSLPAPPSRTSAPPSPTKISSSAPPERISSPSLPLSVSLPKSPSKVSLPLFPRSRSWPVPPRSKSLSSPPPKRSFPLPPSRVSEPASP